MSEQPDLNAIWEQAKQTILEDMGDFNRSLWEAANAAEALALEDDAFVLGIAPGKMSVGSHLTSTANGPLVRSAVQRAVGRAVSVELVEGTDPGAWEREKERRETRAVLAERQAARSRASATAQAVWAELYEEVGEAFGATRDRRYPTSRAAMFARALLAACDAEQRAYEQEPDAAELHEQQLNRTLERIATLSEVPPTMVAIEYMRVKSLKKQ